MKGFTKYRLRALTAIITAALLVPSSAFCQEDINDIRKQMRKAKEEADIAASPPAALPPAAAAESAKKVDYNKLVAEEKKLLEKLENQGTSISVTRELPSAKEEKPIEKVSAPTEKAADYKASIKPKSAAVKPISKQSADEFLELEEKLQSLRGKYEGANTNYSKIKASNDEIKAANSSLETRLNASESKVSKLNKELQKARTRLLVAETEVERLSAVIEERRDVAARQPKPQKINAAASRVGSKVSINEGPNRIKYVDDMPIATVVVKKANIRTGPGVNNSPLMTVSRGTRLAVETRKGDWYRIIAPTGVRAWVNSQVVAFGEDSQSSPSGTVKVQGYNGEAEGEG